EDKSEVAVIDATKHEVVARWPLAPGTEPTGIALDAAHHRLFATCHNKMMEMVDTTNGKVVGSVPIGSGVDGCAFDDPTHLAIAFEHRPGETAFDAPAIDINYGVGDRIQLTLQGGPVLLKRSDHGAIGGLGGTEAAVKWRFIDDQKTGITMSMFPRVLFNLSPSSVRRGLAEDGTRFQIPFQFSKTFSGFDLDLEWGPLVSTVGPAQWLYGVVV